MHVQNIITIQDSIVNIMGKDLYVHLTSMRFFILIMNKTFIGISENYEERSLGLDLDLLAMLEDVTTQEPSTLLSDKPENSSDGP